MCFHLLQYPHSYRNLLDTTQTCVVSASISIRTQLWVSSLLQCHSPINLCTYNTPARLVCIWNSHHVLAKKEFISILQYNMKTLEGGIPAQAGLFFFLFFIFLFFSLCYKAVITRCVADLLLRWCLSRFCMYRISAETASSASAICAIFTFTGFKCSASPKKTLEEKHLNYCIFESTFNFVHSCFRGFGLPSTNCTSYIN